MWDCNHDFPSVLHSINNGHWCSLCKKKTERKFKKWLEENYNYKITYQPKYKWCKSTKNRFLPFDFSIEELKLIIEIDGIQHFEQVSKWRSPEESFINDKYKMEQSIKNNYTIIRIFQEDVFNDTNDWKEKTKEKIKLYEKPDIICIGCEDLYKKFNNIKLYDNATVI